MYEDYNEFVEKYKEYKPKLVVLYQCGGFYEIFNKDKQYMDMLGAQLNLCVTSKGSIYKAGFPIYNLKRYEEVLLFNQYTVVIVNQYTVDKEIRRRVESVISPGTNIDVNACIASNILMSVFISKDNTIGITTIDVTIGEIRAYEIYGNTVELDQLYSLVLSDVPKEMLFSGYYEDDILSKFDICNCIQSIHLENIKNNGNIDYQVQLLTKVYKYNSNQIHIFEWLQLERSPTTVISLVYLLQFVMKHDISIMKSINRPEYVVLTENMVFSYNTVRQLDIISTNGLVVLLNKCVTNIGKRLFIKRLLYPVLNHTTIDQRYNEILDISNDYRHVRRVLSSIYDVERLFRKLLIRKYTIKDYIRIYKSLIQVGQVRDYYKGFSEYSSILTECIQSLDETFDWEYSGLGFLKDDKLQKRLKKYRKYNRSLESILDKINEAVNFDMVKWNKNRTCLVTTKARFKDHKQTLSDMDMSFTFTTVANVVRIRSKNIDQLNDNIVRLEDEIRMEQSTLLNSYTKSFVTRWSCLFTFLVTIIGQLDWSSTCAYNARKHNYCRPVIESTSVSFINAKDVRHPIIEIINRDHSEYVPNDVSIQQQCIIIYGINMVGKSSYMKSVGLNLIMAQSGMFVAASEWKFNIYNKLFVRISSGDNLFQKQSLFAVELYELKHILERADEHSLVLADELASSTESVSSISIVMATILELIHSKSAIVMTTHLHELLTLPQIHHDKIVICHMDVVVDSQTNKLIFNRKLLPGVCETLYGLEVCKSVGLKESFLQLANQIRIQVLHIEPLICSTKKSRYNSKLFVDDCVCGNKASAVHHIKHQADANSLGFIQHIHKNQKFNLVPLCQDCHSREHP